MSELEQLKQAQAARRTNLAEWRAKRVHEIDDMPSGLPVTIKDISLMDVILMDGVEIPNTLIDMMLDNDEKQAKGETDAKSDMQVIREMMSSKDDFNLLLNEIAKACLVEPRIGEHADDTHITLDELPFADKMHLFNFLNREVAAVRPFPDEADAETPAQPGGGVFEQTISDAELAERLDSVSA